MTTLSRFLLTFALLLTTPVWGEDGPHFNITGHGGKDLLSILPTGKLIYRGKIIADQDAELAEAIHGVSMSPSEDQWMSGPCSFAHLLSLLQQQAEFVTDPSPLGGYRVEGNPVGEESLRERAKDLIAQADKLKRQKVVSEEVQKTLAECSSSPAK